MCLIAVIGISSIVRYQFQPFPITPPSFVSTTHNNTNDNYETHPPSSPAYAVPSAQWLIATECAAQSQTRRNIIRTTWQTLYKDPHRRTTTRFILSGYDPLWESLIQEENATHGDIIKLDGLDPSPQTSNRVKFMELLTYLVARGERYAWISKVDDDAFLEARMFYHQYLNDDEQQQRSINDNKNDNYKNNSVLISMKNIQNYPFPWPGGAFYTVSWPLALLLASHHSSHGGHEDQETPEDVRVGKYLYDGEIEFEYREMPREEMFEIPVPGARIPHTITGRAIVVHFLKEHETYLRVARVFGETGFTGEALEGWTE